MKSILKILSDLMENNGRTNGKQWDKFETYHVQIPNSNRRIERLEMIQISDLILFQSSIFKNSWGGGSGHLGRAQLSIINDAIK